MRCNFPKIFGAKNFAGVKTGVKAGVKGRKFFYTKNFSKNVKSEFY